MYDESFAEVDEFAKLDQNSPLIYQMRALIYEQKGDSFNEHVNWGKYNVLKGEKDIALNEFMTAYQYNDKDKDLIETIAAQFDSMKDYTKAGEFYERLIEIEPDNKNALQKLAVFRDSIGDYQGAFEYIDRLKTLDPRNDFVNENYNTYKDHAENGGSVMSFFKSIFGNKMSMR